MKDDKYYVLTEQGDLGLGALVDPDKLSDKNESPSKLLTRMIIVIVLMIALVPNSYVYDYH